MLRPAGRRPDRLLDPSAAVAAVNLLRRVHAVADPEVSLLDPIGVHARIAAGDGPTWCPLTYGYVSYAHPEQGSPLAWSDAPTWRGGQPLSVLGGTGLAVAARSADRADLRAWVRGFMTEDVQTDVVPRAGGQPAHRSVWDDRSELDRSWGDFYSSTAATLAAAWVRPRVPGWVGLQDEASALVREAVVAGASATAVVDHVNSAFLALTAALDADTHHHAAAEREQPMSVAVVTGAGGSLGRAVAVRLAEDGHRVAVTDVAEETLRGTTEALRSVTGHVHAAVADLRDEQALAEFFAGLRDALGPTTVLVNNAAIYPTVPFLEMTSADYDRVQAVNQRGYWLCAQLAGRQMTGPGAEGDRSIVNVSSITAHGGWADLAAYVTTKGAAVGLTRALARELGPLGVRVNAVSPGAFKTAAEEIYDDPEAYSAMVVERQALKRRGTPAELAAVVSFLTGPDAAFVTGQVIEVNGGWVMA